MSGTLALAASIAAMDRDQVERLLRIRRPPESATDPLSLAGELLRSDSIARALAQLPREHLHALRAGTPAEPRHGAAYEQLRQLGLMGLMGGESARLPEVTAVLEAALADRGGSGAMQDPAREAEEEPDGETARQRSPGASHWFAQALTATSHVAECLRLLARQPGRLNRNGSLAVATARSLAESARITDREAMLALTILRHAGCLSEREREFGAARRGLAWLELPHAERWLLLASATIAAMPESLRADAHGRSLTDAASSLRERYPLLPDADVATALDALEQLGYLGLSENGEFTAPGAALLAGSTAEARELAEREMPQVAPGIYVQPDLSVVVPGPLAPEDEALLASLSEVEQLGVASTRRITEATLHAAFEGGLSPERVVSALGRLSLTGVPQPLDYLLTATAERAGSIVVDEYHGDAGRSRITVARAALADTLLADRALHHLHLQRAGDTVLLARLRADHVVAALADARHPAVLAGRPSEAAEFPAATPEPQQDGFAERAARIVAAAAAEPSDFTRRLELAIRDRASVSVSVDVGGAAPGVRRFTVLPISLDAGRLRALDESAGVERTLPVSLITEVE